VRNALRAPTWMQDIVDRGQVHVVWREERRVGYGDCFLAFHLLVGVETLGLLVRVFRLGLFVFVMMGKGVNGKVKSSVTKERSERGKSEPEIDKERESLQA